MDLDSDVSVLSKDSIRYAENIQIITNKDGTDFAIQNADYFKSFRYTKGQLNIDFDKITVISSIAVKYVFKFNAFTEPENTDSIFVITKESSDEGKTINRCLVLVHSINGNFIEQIIWGELGWEKDLKLIYDQPYEEHNNVYIADGNNVIRVINLSKKYGFVENASVIDSVPDNLLQPFQIIGITSGSLKTGKVQYAYQLFNLNGNESSISPLSEMLPVSQTIDGNSQNDIFGSTYGTATTKGFILKANFSKGFSKFRIYRIVYEVAGQTPSVQIADEFDINPNQTELIYKDFGGSYINVITIDEFNALRARYLFVPKTIEVKDNRLFAANIKETTWDVEYDARAYRCDKYGEVVLKDTVKDDITFGIAYIPSDIPEDFDCINPSNMNMFDEDSFKYVFNKDGKFGGTGPNISYEFTFVDVVLSSQDASQNAYKPLNNSILQVEKSELLEGMPYRVSYYDENNSLQKTVSLDKAIIPNYSDLWMCNNCVGYHRDEIYRFGIVFYNKKGIATPVHWIGDIRFPCEMNCVNFDVNSGNKSNIRKTFSTTSQELIGKAIGIKFDVKNIPSEAVSYEIVRCSRDESNRTIVAQVAVSGLVKPYYGTDQNKTYNWTNNGNDKVLYSQPWLNFSSFQRVARHSLHFYYNSGGTGDDGIGGSDTALEDVRSELKDITGFDTSNEVFELISPEICIDQNNVANIIKNNKLCCIGGLFSYYLESSGIYYDRIASAASKVYSMNGDLVNVGERETFGGINYNSGIPFIGSINGSIVHALPGGYDSGEGFSMVLKYYNTIDCLTQDRTATSYVNHQYIPEVLNIKDVIAPNQITSITTFDKLKDFQQAIGENTYINVSVASNNVWGKHGVSLIAQIDQIPDSFEDKWGYEYYNATHISHYDTGHMLNACRICNIKKPSILQTGTFSERSNSVYIGCNAFQTADSNESVYCFGGDTYLGVLDYLNTQYTQQHNDYDSSSEYRIHTQCYIPFETSVNLNLMTNEQYHNTVTNKNENIGQNLISIEPVAYAGHVQKNPLYQYNTVYSQQNNMFPFVTKSLYSTDDLSIPNRIVASEVRSGLEIADPWLKFKVANYINVESKYGGITNLKTFNNRLIFFQDNAIGIASVNERSLITDNNIAQLTLGTGGILNRFDYLSYTNGNSIVNDKSIVNSDSALYWYDYNKNTICALTNNVQELSKSKKVQSYLTNLKLNNKDRSNVISGFDKKYNQIWFKFVDKALIFNERLSAFTTFNTQKYTHFVSTNDGSFMIIDDNLNVKKYNEMRDGSSIQSDSKITFVVNDNFMYPKVFDNVMFYANFGDNLSNISSVVFKTKNQTSEIVNTDDIECREDTYRFAIPRETSDSLYAGRMRGNYLEETFTFDCSNNQTFKIPYIKTTYRQSKI